MSPPEERAARDVRGGTGPLRRGVPPERLRAFEGYVAEILQAFGLDLDTPGTRDTPQRFIRALSDITGGYEGDPKLIAVFDTECRGDVILVEGGPLLMADFFAESLLDELFLTLAPQVVGRDGSAERPGIVAGRRFAPERPLWGTLVGVKRGGSHLFLRYSFASARS